MDAVLCLLPFEPKFYAEHAVRAEFVGHPLADQIPLEPDRAGARRALGLEQNARVVALLPGSREAEVQRLGADFARAAALLAERVRPVPVFLAPMAAEKLTRIFAQQVRAAGAQVRLIDRSADTVLAAADAALVASGTATLQTLLHGCPMVVAYRVAPLTALLARDFGLVKVRYVLATEPAGRRGTGAGIVAGGGDPAGAGARACRWRWRTTDRRDRLQRRFRAIHLELQQGGAGRAAQCILELLATPERQEQGRCNDVNWLPESTKPGAGRWRGRCLRPPSSSIRMRRIRGLRDSKVLTPEIRARLSERIRRPFTGLVHRLGRCRGNRRAQHPGRDAAGDASRGPGSGAASRELVRIDGDRLPDLAGLLRCVPSASCGATRPVAAISAASILAKQARDELMARMCDAYPGYRFREHKGYATEHHLEALHRLGPSPQHRASFAPVQVAKMSFVR